MKTCVYFADTDVFSSDPGLYEACLEVLPEDRRSKAQSYHFDKDRYLSAAVYMLFLIGRYELLGETDKCIISYSSKGKPYLKDERLFFSFSHTTNRAVCAFSDKNIGADIEQINERARPVKSVLSDTEKMIISELSQTESNHAFIRYWTAKEAYSKYTGLGLNEGFASLDMSHINGEGSFGYNGLYICSKDIDGYTLGVCSHYEDIEIKKIGITQMRNIISLYKIQGGKE